jgi:hypothetical protein
LLQIRNVLAGSGFSAVLSPIRRPPSTRQKALSPSQPVSDVPSNSGLNPESSAATARPAREAVTTSAATNRREVIERTCSSPSI